MSLALFKMPVVTWNIFLPTRGTSLFKNLILGALAHFCPPPPSISERFGRLISETRSLRIDRPTSYDTNRPIQTYGVTYSRPKINLGAKVFLFCLHCVSYFLVPIQLRGGVTKKT